MHRVLFRIPPDGSVPSFKKSRGTAFIRWLSTHFVTGKVGMYWINIGFHLYRSLQCNFESFPSNAFLIMALNIENITEKRTRLFCLLHTFCGSLKSYGKVFWCQKCWIYFLNIRIHCQKKWVIQLQCNWVSSSAVSLASGSHLLLFDPFRNKQEGKDKCLWGRGENLFPSICLSMSYVTGISFSEAAGSIPHGPFCFPMLFYKEGSVVRGCVCVSEAQRSHGSIYYIIPRSLMFSLGLFLSV